MSVSAIFHFPLVHGQLSYWSKLRIRLAPCLDSVPHPSEFRLWMYTAQNAFGFPLCHNFRFCHEWDIPHQNTQSAGCASASQRTLCGWFPKYGRSHSWTSCGVVLLLFLEQYCVSTTDKHKSICYHIITEHEYILCYVADLLLPCCCSATDRFDCIWTEGWQG